jgi:hypothetical protein
LVKLLGPRQKEKRSLGVLRMALALAIAAFLGGALGLIWQSASFFGEDAEAEVLTAEVPQD